MKKVFAVAVLTFGLAIVVAAAGQQGQAGPPQGAAPQGARPGGPGGQAPKNLQVLPKDWTIPQVQAMMRTFTAGLGPSVQCTYCHVQDRSSDEKKEKLIGRKMLAMVMAINDQYLKDVGEPLPAAAPAGPGTPPTAPAMKVTCYTCHRGTAQAADGRASWRRTLASKKAKGRRQK